VFGVRPVRFEVKLPEPVPLVVLVFIEIVGLGLVDHTTPLAVTTEPQSPITIPPLFAVVEVISLLGIVVTIGIAVPEKVVTFLPLS
jgi:hypothetical protein